MGASIARLTDKLQRKLSLLVGKGAGSFTVADEVRLALQLLDRNDLIVLDIGANRGEWTEAMVAAAGSRLAQIHLFEPSKHNLETLKRIRDPRVVLVASAAGSVSGEAILYADKPGSGLASLTKRDLDHKGLSFDVSEAVTVVTVDDYLRQHGLTSVDFMKIDVEGHDLEVLKGAHQALTQGVIRALSFEMGGANIDTRTFLRDFWQILTATNYTLFRVSPRLGLIEIPRYREWDETFVTTNYFAVRK